MPGKKGMKRPHKGNRVCKGCKNEFPRQYIINGKGFCENCQQRTAVCQCGCGEKVPFYTTHGYIRRYKDNSHSAVAANNNPEIGKKISAARRKRWRDPRSRKKNIKGLKKAWDRDEERHERQRELAQKQWADPEYRISHSGKKHHNWNPDRTDTYYGPNWPEIRRSIRKRDNHTCQACSRKFNPAKRIELSDLVVHHIEPFNGNQTEANRASNLVCLCRACHRSVHNGTLESPVPS